ncbi:MAG TPA: heme o synthase [Acidimicrobiia bacterium]|nr:heme o synthase [Acidimicrobiia bacterium]
MDSPSVVIAEPSVRRGVVSAYFALTKPRIIELLLITTVPAMVLAAEGWPGWWPVLATLIGGSLSAGGANAMNNWFDRDIDEVMRRTRRRPLPRHEIEPAAALRFGIVLGVAGFAWLWAFTNILAALLSTAALLFYVLVYTMGLKRRTAQNIVIGGAAGAVPPLVGWAAVTGEIGLPAWVLFALVFYWTPPHFWALALRFEDDYARARVPMLPVVRGTEQTLQSILLYSVTMVLLSLLLVPVGRMGWVYLVAAIGSGAWFLWSAWRVKREPARAMKLFTDSTVYLAVLFAAVAVDVFVR